MRLDKIRLYDIARHYHYRELGFYQESAWMRWRGKPYKARYPAIRGLGKSRNGVLREANLESVCETFQRDFHYSDWKWNRPHFKQLRVRDVVLRRMTRLWGKQCETFDPGCSSCLAWGYFLSYRSVPSVGKLVRLRLTSNYGVTP